MTSNYRKMYGGLINVPSEILDSTGTLKPDTTPPSPLPVSPAVAPSGTHVAPPTFGKVVAAAPVFDPQGSNDSHTSMVGGIPSVFRRSYGG